MPFNNVKDVRNHLRKQSDVKRTSIVVIDGMNYVKAIIENTDHRNLKIRREVFYDHKGCRVSLDHLTGKMSRHA